MVPRDAGSRSVNAAPTCVFDVFGGEETHLGSPFVINPAQTEFFRWVFYFARMVLASPLLSSAIEGIRQDEGIALSNMALLSWHLYRDTFPNNPIRNSPWPA